MNSNQYQCNMRMLILGGISNLPAFSINNFSHEPPLFTWYMFSNTVSEVDVSCSVVPRVNARDIAQMDESIIIERKHEYVDSLKNELSVYLR
jgi:hypothetical protein